MHLFWNIFAQIRHQNCSMVLYGFGMAPVFYKLLLSRLLHVNNSPQKELNVVTNESFATHHAKLVPDSMQS